MREGSNIRDHINKFNKCITQLLSLEVGKDVEDQTIIVVSFLPRSYETLMTTHLVGKTTLTMDEVKIVLLKTENMKGPSSSHGDHVLAVKSGVDHGRSILRGRYNDRRDNHSQI